MPRPRLNRRIRFDPHVTYFKPRGVPMRFLKVVHLTIEEAEALRLKDVSGLDQTEAAERMSTSQSTFQRILASARHKVATALTKGLAIEIARNDR